MGSEMCIRDRPFSDGRRRAWLHQAGVVQREETTEDGVVIHVKWTERQQVGFEALTATASS